ncbi:phosphoglycerate mutase [Flavobacteriaceae bacterium R38]|nr:phosphoglycerate mutase [Flavobacteriaceae bacterium R38]
MQRVILFLFIVAYNFTGYTQDIKGTETTTIYFIRHAEKDRSNPNDRNPALTQDGLGRAVKWAEVLKNQKLDAVYSTDYNRTKQTAAPSAAKNGLEVTLYDPRNFNPNTLKELKEKTILVVGHSNTTPAMVNTILGSKKYQQIDDSNNGNLYVVTIQNGTVVNSTLLYIN